MINYHILPLMTNFDMPLSTILVLCLTQVERVELVKFNSVIMIERGCASACPYGCRYNGLAVTYMRCISCCETPACNTGNLAVTTKPSWTCLILIVLCYTLCSGTQYFTSPLLWFITNKLLIVDLCLQILHSKRSLPLFANQFPVYCLYCYKT